MADLAEESFHILNLPTGHPVNYASKQPLLRKKITNISHEKYPRKQNNLICKVTFCNCLSMAVNNANV